jgi:hypothetical protein
MMLYRLPNALDEKQVGMFLAITIGSEWSIQRPMENFALYFMHVLFASIREVTKQPLGSTPPKIKNNYKWWAIYQGEH